MKAKIVVADDEPRIRKMIARLLTDEGYDVMPVENGREAVEALLSFQPDVILLDQQMPVLTGVEALEEIRRISPTQVVLFVTAFGSISLAVDAVKKGAYDFIEKPFDNDKLLLTVKRAVEHSRMKGEISTLKNQCDRPDPRRERYRKRTDRPCRPPQQPAGKRSFRCDQLRRHSPDIDGKRTIRP